ncbi:MAG: alpha/beta hydrolase [Sphingomicrobium sp.]
MGKLIASAGVAALLLGSIAVAQQQRERLPAECRQEIADLCRGAEGGFRACIRSALPKLSDTCRKAIGERGASAPPTPGTREIAYGADPKQKLDLLVPANATRAPLILFVHGGGWSIGDKRTGAGVKAAHFTAQGWAFASANYRLVPQASVEQQAADVASAVAWARANAAGQRLDPDRIVLMGHSAGAHLVALVGTDPRYLAAAGVPIGAVKGVILLDGAGYDIAQQMAQPKNAVAGMYDAAFGKDPARQKALSPTLHAAAPNVARWLILPIDRRDDSKAQSQGLAAALSQAGAVATVVAVPGESHSSLNKGLGEASDFATGHVDNFLARLR